MRSHDHYTIVCECVCADYLPPETQLFWDGFIHRKEKVPSPVERLTDTFGEWWLMSLCDVVIADGMSGYSRTAFAYAQKGVAYNMVNYEGKGLFSCERGLSQEELAYLGGGY